MCACFQNNVSTRELIGTAVASRTIWLSPAGINMEARRMYRGQAYCMMNMLSLTGVISWTKCT
jgi:hypothetical protein